MSDMVREGNGRILAATHEVNPAGCPIRDGHARMHSECAICGEQPPTRTEPVQPEPQCPHPYCSACYPRYPCRADCHICHPGARRRRLEAARAVKAWGLGSEAWAERILHPQEGERIMNVTLWNSATAEQRDEWIAECRRNGHDFYYVEGSEYQWDCARCNWSDYRLKPTLPLTPSMPHGRFQIIDAWQPVWLRGVKVS
jgi:hypothetical protein